MQIFVNLITFSTILNMTLRGEEKLSVIELCALNQRTSTKVAIM